MKARRYLLIFTSTAVLLFAVTYAVLIQASFGLRSHQLLNAINGLSFFAAFPLLYVTLAVYDVTAQSLLRLKVLYYLMLAAAVWFLLVTFKDGWAFIIAVYLIVISAIHLLVMYAIRKYRLPFGGIRLRREFYVFLGLLLFVMAMFIIAGYKQTVR
jgi:hypothetical protein